MPDHVLIAHHHQLNEVMIDVAIVVTVVISAVWVYWDATRNRIGKVPGIRGISNNSAGAWAAATLLIRIVGFPMYLLKRRTLIERANSHPVDVSARNAKTAVLGAAGAMCVLLAAYMAVLARLPTCSSSNAVALVGAIIDDMPLVKAAGAKYVSIKQIEEQAFNENAQIRSCTATLVTTAGEGPLRYSIRWNDKATAEFYVQVQPL